MNSLDKIRGIGPQTAKNLVEHGFADVGAVAGAAVADLAAVPGFSVARAEKTIEAAKALMEPGKATRSRKASAKRPPPGKAQAAEVEEASAADKPDKKRKGGKAKKEKKGGKENKKGKEKKGKKGKNKKSKK